MRDTIDMAREAGILEPIELLDSNQWRQDTIRELKAFEALVRADERDTVMNEPLTKAQWQRFEDEIRADEREACAKVCESLWRIDGQFTADEFAAEVRARGNT